MVAVILPLAAGEELPLAGLGFFAVKGESVVPAELLSRLRARQ